jgi:hypothetical protein
MSIENDPRKLASPVAKPSKSNESDGYMTIATLKANYGYACCEVPS